VRRVAGKKSSVRRCAYEYFAPRQPGGKLRESYERACKRYAAKTRGGGVVVPPEAELALLCDSLDVMPHELRQLDTETVLLLEAWRDGKALAEWASVTAQARPRPSAHVDESLARGGATYGNAS